MSGKRYATAADFADRIEAELKASGHWSATAPEEAAFESREAFFADTMPFHQWVQFVLVSRVRSIVETRGRFPGSSSVGAYAVRELDGSPEDATLVNLLCEFDAFIEEA